MVIGTLATDGWTGTARRGLGGLWPHPVPSSSRGGDWTSLLGPGEPYTPHSEKDTSCLGPVEPYAPSTHISELIVLAHIGKKREPKGRPTTLAGQQGG